jgi:hypothetical protein
VAGGRGRLSRFLSSPRRRRRLAWLAAIAAFGGGLTAVVVLVTGPANRIGVRPARPGAPQVVERRPRVHLARGEIRRVHDVAVRFIDTAVRREHVEDSWKITDASMKAGFTRGEWAKGNIPAPPFPADSPRYAPYHVLYSFPADVALTFALLPEHDHPEYGPASFIVELVNRHGRWLVSSFTPASSGSLDQVQQRGELKNDVTRNVPAPDKAQLNAWWLIVPAISVVSLALIVPLSFLARNRLRRARVARLYNSSSSPS